MNDDEKSPPPEATAPARSLNRPDDHVYEELTRTNNELANLHREVARQNAELAAAQKKLQASEQRYRSLSACSPIGILEMDVAGRCLYSNPHWQTITGLSVDESLGDGWQGALDPRDKPAFLKAWNLALNAGREFNRELRFVTTRGDSRWAQVRSRAILDPRGEIAGRVSTIEDITERKRSERKLRQLSQAMEQSPASVVITDIAGNIEYVNPKFIQITGYTLAEVLGKTPRVLKSGETNPEGYREMWQTITAGKEWRGEFHNRKKNGELYWESASISPVRDLAGQVTHYLAVKEDITERKLAQAELEQTHRELLDVSRQAGMAEVATSVLHNVGNVLNSVNVISTMLAERLRKSKLTSLSKLADLVLHHEADLAGFLTMDPKGRQLPGFLAKLAAHLFAEREFALRELAQLQDHIEHIKEIVNMQQAFAKVSIITEALLPADLVEEALRLKFASLTRHDIVVIRDYQNVPPLTVEKHKVLQILVNLMRNAKQACVEAGHAEKRLTLRISSDNGRVRFAVSDNGVGIAPENLTRIFAHGFTTKAEGHGFGLHSAALAAGEMGGSLTVHSDGPGRGAVFTLELPVG